MKTLGEMIETMQASSTRVIRARRMYGSSKWGDWFTPCNPQWDWSTHDYEVVPEPKRVPLGPDDVPPGSVFRCRKWPRYPSGWWPGYPADTSVHLACGHNIVSYPDLVGDWEISRDGGKTWLFCWKEVA